LSVANLCGENVDVVGGFIPSRVEGMEEC